MNCPCGKLPLDKLGLQVFETVREENLYQLFAGADGEFHTGLADNLSRTYDGEPDIYCAECGYEFTDEDGDYYSIAQRALC